VTKDVDVTKTKVGDRTIHSVDVGNMSAKQARKVINEYREEHGMEPVKDNMFWIRVAIVLVAVTGILALIGPLLQHVSG